MRRHGGEEMLKVVIKMKLFASVVKFTIKVSMW